MWQRCRTIALQQLQRRITASPPSTAHGLLAVASNATRTTSAFLPFHQTYTTVAGMDLDRIATSTRAELAAELGDQRLNELRTALVQEFKDMVKTDDVQGAEIKQLFRAGIKTKLPSLSLEAFYYLEDHFPEDLDFVLYGEVFRLLSNARESEKLLNVYYNARTRYTNECPEMIYRFGIVGHLEAGDMEAALSLYNEMKDSNVTVPNEILARVMVSLARANRIDDVLDVYEEMDPQAGFWHESAVDRVLLSLGLIKQPEKAFEFYINSNMKLSSNTLVTLLSVSRHNGCVKQATDILENRKRFDLVLHTRAYNAIMETLEFLERPEEIVQVLEEMHAKGVRRDRRTYDIMERQQDLLKGTSFEVSIKPKRMPMSTTGSKIRDYLEHKQFEEAAAVADSLVEFESISDDDEAQGAVAKVVGVPEAVARDVALAYLSNGQHDKVHQLVKYFGQKKGKYARALGEISGFYMRRGKNTRYDNVLFDTFVALQFQDGFIMPVSTAINLFGRRNHVDGIVTILEQIISQHKEKKAAEARREEDLSMGAPVRERSLGYNFGRTLNQILEQVVLLGQFEKLMSAFNLIHQHDVTIVSASYIKVLAGMRQVNIASRKKQHGNRQRDVVLPYTADHFEAMWLQVKTEGIPMEMKMLGNFCVGMASGNKRQRLKLLEAYQEVRDHKDESFTLPRICYSALMECASKEGDLDLLQQIYEDAIATLSSTEALPKEWPTRLIIGQAEAGDTDGAMESLAFMAERCNGYSYEAVVAIMRSCAKTQETEKVNQLVQIVEEREFRISLQDAFELMQVAKHAKSVHLASEVIRLYEGPDATASTDEENGHDDVTTSTALPMMAERGRKPNRSALKRITSMYRMALSVCENGGEWKKALQLNSRIEQLQNQLDAFAPQQPISANEEGEESEETTVAASDSAVPAGKTE